ncbi:hypothetical protein WMY93_015810 [Mugilogobius chulae]|uniref:Uncharacterized protein n=1 Tax=Mugilogobius chulae TaxID=88201 RepID=A0AAW0NXK8_9GOBI
MLCFITYYEDRTARKPTALLYQDCSAQTCEPGYVNRTWEDIEDGSCRDFIEEYITAYPSRPMVLLKFKDQISALNLLNYVYSPTCCVCNPFEKKTGLQKQLIIVLKRSEQALATLAVKPEPTSQSAVIVKNVYFGRFGGCKSHCGAECRAEEEIPFQDIKQTVSRCLAPTEEAQEDFTLSYRE